MRFRAVALALALGTTLAIAFGSVASAMTIIKLTGNYGDFGTTTDGPGDPGARCGYSAPVSGVAHLAWIKVYAFKIAAFDRNPAVVDQQPVKFMATLQRSTNGGTTWKNVGSSVSQTRTTHENQSAAFTDLKVVAPVKGQSGQLFRAMVTIQWLHNGHVDGLAKVRINQYGVKWTVGSPTYEFADACAGAAD